MGQGCRPGRTMVLRTFFHAKIIIESPLLIGSCRSQDCIYQYRTPYCQEKQFYIFDTSPIK